MKKKKLQVKTHTLKLSWGQREVEPTRVSTQDSSLYCTVLYSAVHKTSSTKNCFGLFGVEQVNRPAQCSDHKPIQSESPNISVEPGGLWLAKSPGLSQWVLVWRGGTCLCRLSVSCCCLVSCRKLKVPNCFLPQHPHWNLSVWLSLSHPAL